MLSSLTVPPAAVPGAHLVATFEPAGRGSAIEDQAWLEVGRRRPLRVRLTLPPGPHRAGGDLVARLQVRGAPKGAHMVLRVVAPDTLDDALEAERNAFTFFHRPRPRSWRTHVATGRYRQPRILALASPAPQAAPMLPPQGAFMSEPGKVGKSGNRLVSIKLPVRQGRALVEAIVWNEDRIGTATAQVEVRDPLAITAVAPSVLTAGDAVELPVTLFRGPEAPGTVVLSTAAIGGLEVIGGIGGPFDLAPGGRATSRVRVSATASGVLTLAAASERERVQWRHRITVRPIGASTIVGAGLSASNKTSVTVPWPPVPGRSRIAVGSTPVYQAAVAATRLARAARDDLETSAARALYRQGVPDLSRPQGPGGNLRAVPGRWNTGLSAVERCLGPDGPLAWPDGPAAEAGTVVLAGHAVVRAARRGLVSANFDRWMDAVRTAARSGTASPRTVAHGQWVLALGRRPDRSMLEQLQTQWGNQPPDLASGVGLAAALSRAGFGRRASALLKFTDVTVLAPEDAAFVLAGLADADPRHPVVPELTTMLVDALSSGAPTRRRTDALALIGLARMSLGPQGPRPFWGRLYLGEREVRRFKGPVPAVVGDFDDAARAQDTFRLAIDAGGPVFASVVVEGPAATSASGAVKTRLQLVGSQGRPVDKLQVGDRAVLKMTVGPLPTAVRDLRMSIPIPSGMTVAGVRPPSLRSRVERAPGVIAFDLSAPSGATLNAEVDVAATFGGDFALGPARVFSTLAPAMAGATQATRVAVSSRRTQAVR